MERNITGYHQDDQRDWVAELCCGHDQHVRHRPPFQPRLWVLDAEGRTARLGTPLECPLCERAEMPNTLRHVRTTPIWDHDTMPTGLRRAHRIATGTWGRIVVGRGRLRYTAATAPAIRVELREGETQAIPPELDHEVEPLGAVSFVVEFFVVDRGSQSHTGIEGRRVDPREPTEQGGDPACWAGLICPECGAMLDGGEHRGGCPAAEVTR